MQFTIAAGSVGKDWEKREVVESLYEALKELEDKRKRRGIRYPLAVALVMLVVAKLWGQDELRGMADWIKWRAALFTEGLSYHQAQTPHHTTLSRILNEAVDMTALEDVVNGYVARQQTSSGCHRAIDGKTLQGTLDKQGQQGQHLLSVYDTALGNVQAQGFGSQTWEIIQYGVRRSAVDLKIRRSGATRCFCQARCARFFAVR